ncbi:hypothetical protein CYMTET_31202 [Cymbomonas tetramitiformis]|uniref:Dynein heavy chain AAA module D4 domain-containing protein n=1 Tax=Cymbomonas tetramitiformis TaxID=36881 RepID=A0AAE0FHQ2_9CHLO|nr:hypothetical protein CYMTET_31202 [Cymbomonas tetramitiformis]
MAREGDALGVECQNEPKRHKYPLGVVLFPEACQHLARLLRLCRAPEQHALLLGVSGSGRRTLAKLAASIAQYELMEVGITGGEFTELMWQSQLRQALRAAAFGDSDLMLVVRLELLSSEMQHRLLHDLCQLLKLGDVPGLFGAEERREIRKKVASAKDSVLWKMKNGKKVNRGAMLVNYSLLNMPTSQQHHSHKPSMHCAFDVAAESGVPPSNSFGESQPLSSPCALSQTGSTQSMLARRRSLYSTPAHGEGDGAADQLYSLFSSEVQMHLHLVLCVSSLGEELRTCCRFYPSLVSQVTIDWYDQWNVKALQAVANAQFRSRNFQVEPPSLASMIRTCALLHLEVREEAARQMDMVIALHRQEDSSSEGKPGSARTPGSAQGPPGSTNKAGASSTPGAMSRSASRAGMNSKEEQSHSNSPSLAGSGRLADSSRRSSMTHSASGTKRRGRRLSMLPVSMADDNEEDVQEADGILVRAGGPSSLAYTELLTLCERGLAEKQHSTLPLIDRMHSGLAKLDSTSTQVWVQGQGQGSPACSLPAGVASGALTSFPWCKDPTSSIAFIGQRA